MRTVNDGTVPAGLTTPPLFCHCMRKSAYTLEDSLMRQLIKAAKALSDETRLKILNLLLERECCVCEVMAILDISQTRASRNLGILESAGLLKMRKVGLWALYSIDPAMSQPTAELVAAVGRSLAKDEAAQSDRQLLRTTEPRVACCAACPPLVASGAGTGKENVD